MTEKLSHDGGVDFAMPGKGQLEEVDREYIIADHEKAMKFLEMQLVLEKRMEGDLLFEIKAQKPGKLISSSDNYFDKPVTLPVKTKVKEFKTAAERKLTKREANFWFNEDWLVKAKQLNNAVNEYVSQYGCKPLTFEPRHYELFSSSSLLVIILRILKGGVLGGFYETITSNRGLNTSIVRGNPEHFKEIVVHEKLHRHSLSLLKGLKSIFTGNNFFSIPLLLRSGPTIALNKKKQEMYGSKYVFRALEEAIVEKTALKILEKTDRRKPGDEQFGYKKLVRLYDRIVHNIMFYQNSIGSQMKEGEVEKAFEKATFGKGHLLDMARLINGTYGDIGGFKTFAEKMMILDKYEMSINPFKRWFKGKDYKDALDFISREGNYRYSDEEKILKLQPALVPA